MVNNINNTNKSELINPSQCQAYARLELRQITIIALYLFL